MVISHTRSQYEVDHHIKGCLNDCELGEISVLLMKIIPLLVIAIAIIEQGIWMPDSAVVLIDALKLGYICCERLNNELKTKLKRKEFEHSLSELNITLPKSTEQIRNEVIYINIHYNLGTVFVWFNMYSCCCLDSHKVVVSSKHCIHI